MADALAAYRREGHAQYGEDGVIEELFKRIGEESRYCVEFGAGSTATSTLSLIERGWSALLIEADPGLADGLRENFAGNPRVATLKALVEAEGENKLDTILTRHKASNVFDLLVIDIDGDDYHIWDSLREHRPRAVMIEYNGRIPFDISFIQPHDPRVKSGSSLSALVALGKEKGYELVYAHVANALFVTRELFPKVGVADNHPESLAEPITPNARFFELYDGSIVLTGIDYDRLLARKKKIRGAPVHVLQNGTLKPVPFALDRAPLRFLKNLVLNSPLRPVALAAARAWYGRRPPPHGKTD